MKKTIIVCMLIISLLLTGCGNIHTEPVIVKPLSEVYIGVSMPEEQPMMDVLCISMYISTYLNLESYVAYTYEYTTVIKETDSVRYFIDKPIFDIKNFEDNLFFSTDFNKFKIAVKDNNDTEIKCYVRPFKSTNDITLTKTTTINTLNKPIYNFNEFIAILDVDGVKFRYQSKSEQPMSDKDIQVWVNNMIDNEISKVMYVED